MPGAAGLVAANSIYRAGCPDGLTVMNFQGAQVMGQILGREGVEFDARKFEWLGAPTRENSVCALTRASGITTLEQWAASRTPVKLGSVAPGGATHDVPRVLPAALGLPIHLVRGYAMPPATPANRVRLLRAAFLKTLSDPEFGNDARPAQLDIDPISGEDVARLVAELFKIPPAVLARLKELLR